MPSDDLTPAPAPSLTQTLSPSAGFFAGVIAAINHGAAHVYHDVLAIEDDVTAWTEDNPTLVPLVTMATSLATSFATRMGLPVGAISVLGGDVIAALKAMAAQDATVGSGKLNTGANAAHISGPPNSIEIPPAPGSSAPAPTPADVTPAPTSSVAATIGGLAVVCMLGVGALFGLSACAGSTSTTTSTSSSSTATPTVTTASSQASMTLTAIEAGYTLLANDAAACISSGACNATVTADLKTADAAVGATITAFRTSVQSGGTVDQAALAALPALVTSITGDLTTAGKLSPLAQVAITTGLQMLSLYLNPSQPITVTLPASPTVSG